MASDNGDAEKASEPALEVSILAEAAPEVSILDAGRLLRPLQPACSGRDSLPDYSRISPRIHAENTEHRPRDLVGQ